MLNLNFTPFPEITTDRLKLRQIVDSDVADLFAIRSDEKVMKFIGRPIAKTHEDAYKLMKIINDTFITNDGITWAVTQKKDQKLIGTICYWRIEKENYRAEIGYALNSDFHGKGIMQEAMTAIIDYGFKVMKLHSIEANVDPNNSASIKLLERNKFIKEAHYKENYFFEGKFLDTAIYSLLTNDNK